MPTGYINLIGTFARSLMLNNNLRRILTPWIEEYMGISLSKLSDTKVPIFLSKRQIGSGDGEQKDLIAIEIEGKRGLVE